MDISLNCPPETVPYSESTVSLSPPTVATLEFVKLYAPPNIDEKSPVVLLPIPPDIAACLDVMLFS